MNPPSLHTTVFNSLHQAGIQLPPDATARLAAALTQTHQPPTPIDEWQVRWPSGPQTARTPQHLHQLKTAAQRVGVPIVIAHRTRYPETVTEWQEINE